MVWLIISMLLLLLLPVYIIYLSVILAVWLWQSIQNNRVRILFTIILTVSIIFMQRNVLWQAIIYAGDNIYFFLTVAFIVWIVFMWRSQLWQIITNIINDGVVRQIEVFSFIILTTGTLIVLAMQTQVFKEQTAIFAGQNDLFNKQTAIFESQYKVQEQKQILDTHPNVETNITRNKVNIMQIKDGNDRKEYTVRDHKIMSFIEIQKNGDAKKWMIPVKGYTDEVASCNTTNKCIAQCNICGNFDRVKSHIQNNSSGLTGAIITINYLVDILHSSAIGGSNTTLTVKRHKDKAGYLDNTNKDVFVTYIKRHDSLIKECGYINIDDFDGGVCSKISMRDKDHKKIKVQINCYENEKNKYRDD